MNESVPHDPGDEKAIESTNGTRVAVVRRGASERIEVRDRSSRLIFELDTTTHKATLCVPDGDLSVLAPNGNIDLVAGGSVSIQSKSLAIGAENAELRVKDVAFAGLRLAARIGDLTIAGERIETTATRIFERAKSVFRTAEDLAQLKAGRARTVVEGSYAVRSGHTSIESRQETKIDGSEILLG